MFPNAVMMQHQTWNDILRAMIAVRNAHGWSGEDKETAGPPGNAVGLTSKKTSKTKGKKARKAGKKRVASKAKTGKARRRAANLKARKAMTGRKVSGRPRKPSARRWTRRKRF